MSADLAENNLNVTFILVNQEKATVFKKLTLN